MPNRLIGPDRLKERDDGPTQVARLPRATARIPLVDSDPFLITIGAFPYIGADEDENTASDQGDREDDDGERDEEHIARFNNARYKEDYLNIGSKLFVDDSYDTLLMVRRDSKSLFFCSLKTSN